jgi:hypothetical protein
MRDRDDRGCGGVGLCPALPLKIHTAGANWKY